MDSLSGRQIIIGAGFNDQSLAYFHLRSISVAEEEDFTAKITALSELTGIDRVAAELETCVAALELWSGSVVSGAQDAKTQKYAPYFDTQPEGNGVRAFFAQFDVSDAHRLASQLIYAFRLKLQPTVVFP